MPDDAPAKMLEWGQLKRMVESAGVKDNDLIIGLSIFMAAQELMLVGPTAHRNGTRGFSVTAIPEGFATSERMDAFRQKMTEHHRAQGGEGDVAVRFFATFDVLQEGDRVSSHFAPTGKAQS